MQIHVIKIEIRVLVVRHEDIIIAILQTHVGFEDKIVRDKKSEKGINTHSSQLEKLDPFYQLDVLVNDFSLLEGKVFVGFCAGDLDERLVEVDGVENVAFQTEQSFERGSENFRVSQAVCQIRESLFIRSNNVVFRTFVRVEMVVYRTVFKFLFSHINTFSCSIS